MKEKRKIKKEIKILLYILLNLLLFFLALRYGGTQVLTWQEISKDFIYYIIIAFIMGLLLQFRHWFFTDRYDEDDKQ